MPKLVEEIKKLREKRSLLDKLVIQNIEWDLDPIFIGEPMVPRTLKALSHYVDSKLIGYSTILGSVPATGRPGSTLAWPLQGKKWLFGRPPPSPRLPDGPPCLQYDDHVASESAPGAFIDVPELYDAAEQHGIFCYTNPRDQSQETRPVRPLQICDRGEILQQPDDPNIPDIHTEVDMVDENTGRPGSDLLRNFVDTDEQIPETSYLSELEEDNEHDAVIIGGSINSMQTTPEIHTFLRENQENQELRAIAKEHDFLNTENREPRAIIEGNSPGTTLNAPYGSTSSREDLQVYSHGALPHSRERFRDSFVRDRHVTFKILPESLSSEKEVSYITSYTIEHSTLKIKARVITAPNNFQVLDDVWYELCDSEGKQSPSLKDMVRNTIKANLCIISKSRAESLSFLSLAASETESEKTALQTLRDMISEGEFRNYLRYGFIAVRGQTGLVYQIWRRHPHTKVWSHGELIEEICVRIKDRNIPPTDNVIAFKIMIETSEDLFRSRGNVYKMNKKAA